MSDDKSSRSPLITGIIILVLILIAWHFIFPAIGLVGIMSGGIFSAIIVSVIAFCIAILFTFLLTGFGLVVVGALAFIWAVVFISLFPVMLPVLIPLLIIVLIVSHLRKRKNKS